MVWEKYEKKGANFISTSIGIVTSDGIFFHVNEDAIENYAPGLLDKRALNDLVTEAVVWVKSASNLSLFFYLATALLLPVSLTVVLTLLFFSCWFYLRSAFVTPHLSGVMKIINADTMLIGSTLIGLSYLGMTENYGAFGMGILFYLIFKMDLIRRFIDYLMPKVTKNVLQFNDRIFRILITKYAIKFNISTDDTKQFKQQIMKLFQKRNS